MCACVEIDGNSQNMNIYARIYGIIKIIKQMYVYMAQI